MESTNLIKPAPGLGKGPANYHTHTSRCGHATGRDIDYVNQAIAEGFSVLGFSDHTPFKAPFKTRGNVRMLESELPDYVASINSLKEQFKDRIDIHVGLEVEPFFQYFDWLKEKVQESGIEYLILGHHYGGMTEFDGYYGSVVCDVPKLRKYVEIAEKAMDPDLYIYMAHPDLPFSNYPRFDKECERLSVDICTLAQERRIPLEYNISGYQKRLDGQLYGVGYPADQFWEIARDYDIDVYIGFDAHKPERIVMKQFKETEAKLRAMGFRVVNA